MTPAEQQQIADALQSKIAATGKRPACPMCGGGDLGVEAHFAYIGVGATPEVVIGPAFPAAMVGCKTCGNIQIHSLITLGLGHMLPPPPAETPSQA
jgi:hypothetical protein